MATINPLVAHILPDVVTYWILIHGYCKVGKLVDAVSLYNHMLEAGVMSDGFIQRILTEYNLQNDHTDKLNTQLKEVQERDSLQ